MKPLMLKRQTIASRKVLAKAIADPGTGEKFNSTDGRKSNSDHTTVFRTSLFGVLTRSKTQQVDGCCQSRGLYVLAQSRSG